MRTGLRFPDVSILLVTGTSTGVGKTGVTATLAVLCDGPVAVCKPARTSVEAGTDGDPAEVEWLSGAVTTPEPARYPDPLGTLHDTELAVRAITAAGLDCPWGVAPGGAAGRDDAGSTGAPGRGPYRSAREPGRRLVAGDAAGDDAAGHDR